ncbi:MAG: DUF4367 domain-containing protein [Nitrosopumilus sp.]|nr:DUF4367 domain-containing protein [Nitrosopumilus sp.]
MQIDNFGDEPIYQYYVNPDGLSGTIMVKGYPRCMTESEVKSLYSQVEAYPNFPTYLPEGYSFECGVHNMNGFVHLGYWTDSLREKFDDTANDTTSQEFFANRGLTVDYYNEYVINNWTSNPDYDKYKKQDEKAEHPWATKLTVSGEPAVFRVQYITKSGQQNSYNELLIFLDGEIRYGIRSSMPQDEMVKIAESLFFEPKSPSDCRMKYGKVYPDVQICLDNLPAGVVSPHIKSKQIP